MVAPIPAGALSRAHGGQAAAAAAGQEPVELAPVVLARWWRRAARDPETWMNPELAPLLPEDTDRGLRALGDRFSSRPAAAAAAAAPAAPSANPHTLLARLAQTAAGLAHLAEKQRAAEQVEKRPPTIMQVEKRSFHCLYLRYRLQTRERFRCRHWRPSRPRAGRPDGTRRSGR